jgi:hypothetical protein
MMTNRTGVPAGLLVQEDDDVARLLPRVRCEFLEMPGLRLTVAQAARL